MEWHETTPDVGERWEREDGYAIVSVRETATGTWAVTYDRLEQAPEGETYRRETCETADAALALAAEWREADSEDP